MDSGKLKEKDRMPDLQENYIYLEAFIELSTERQIGMASGPIPFFAILQYKNYYELSDDFLDIIMLIDRFYLEKEEKDNATKIPSGRKAAKK